MPDSFTIEENHVKKTIVKPTVLGHVVIIFFEVV